MDEFTTYEHDTLITFLPYLEQKINSSYRRQIASGTGETDELVRAVEQYPFNIKPIRRNRPDLLGSQQWDDLLYLVSRLVNDAGQNQMARQIHGKNAGKCYQILLSKALSKANEQSPSAPRQSEAGQSQTAGRSSRFLLRTSMFVTALLIIALLVMLLTAPQSSATLVLLIALLFCLSASLVLMIRHRRKRRTDS